MGQHESADRRNEPAGEGLGTRLSDGVEGVRTGLTERRDRLSTRMDDFDRAIVRRDEYDRVLRHMGHRITSTETTVEDPKRRVA